MKTSRKPVEVVGAIFKLAAEGDQVQVRELLAGIYRQGYRDGQLGRECQVWDDASPPPAAPSTTVH